MFKKLFRKILFVKWVLQQKFRRKEHSVWDDWYLSSNKPYIWDRSFLKKIRDGEKQ